MDDLLTKSKPLFLLLLILLPIAAADLTDDELAAAADALRLHGYTLFPNAIATSDLNLRLLSSSNSSSAEFTLFSPPDALLFSLDLASPAPLYVRTLFRHVSPYRLAASDLRSLQNGSYINSLDPQNVLSIEDSVVVVNGTVLESFLVNGVRISVPDLYLGSDIAVHGLEGILYDGFASPFTWPVGNATGNAPPPTGSGPASGESRDSRSRRPRRKHGHRRGSQQGFQGNASTDGSSGDGH